ncbi:hypothetical protein [Propionivibrio limicola]|uniref:hypothetical protein n=1 Tax=Propionivibrio limicola TaxID=167645 RepID=UPI001290A906|nr:hypothetical protein [Propionivibrio limicola]
MKINPVNFLIAVLVSAILAYALWSFGGDLKNYVAIGAFVFFAGTLAPMIGGSFELSRNSTNLRVTSAVFFVLGLIINGLFSMITFPATAYIVVSAIAFLLYVFLANAVYGARQ